MQQKDGSAKEWGRPVLTEGVVVQAHRILKSQNYRPDPFYFENEIVFMNVHTSMEHHPYWVDFQSVGYTY
jgi:hypothetical protein